MKQFQPNWGEILTFIIPVKLKFSYYKWGWEGGEGALNKNNAKTIEIGIGYGIMEADIQHSG